MADPLPSPPDPPEVCPGCRADKGRPFAVQTAGPGFVDVSYRCLDCQHEWMSKRRIDVHTPTIPRH